MVKIKALERVKPSGIFQILWVASYYTMTSQIQHCYFKGEATPLTFCQWIADHKYAVLFQQTDDAPSKPFDKDCRGQKKTHN